MPIRIADEHRDPPPDHLRLHQHVREWGLVLAYKLLEGVPLWVDAVGDLQHLGNPQRATDARDHGPSEATGHEQLAGRRLDQLLRGPALPETNETLLDPDERLHANGRI